MKTRNGFLEFRLLWISISWFCSTTFRVVVVVVAAAIALVGGGSSSRSSSSYNDEKH